MRYLPHTGQDVRAMLDTIGVGTVEELFAEIPPELRLQRPLDLPAPLAEAELTRALRELADQNRAARLPSFLGGGAYDHFIPAVVDYLVGRGEFTTAYTPYQPEISQGTLQAIFEFQTLICQLTGLDVANASLYDGASATAEAVLMAVRATRRRKVLISQALHPQVRATVATYVRYLEVELVELPLAADGRTDLDAARALLDDASAALVLGYPNYFGAIEDLAAAATAAHAAGARLVATGQEAVALGLLRSPGELGADIVAGEGQSLGLPLSYGGPYLGFFAARERDLRSFPGRLVGETVDRDGKRGFVLTLATREQHIRREKATSNICSNQGMCTVMATIFMSLLGKQGLRQLAEQNHSKAAYARARIAALPGFTLPFAAPFFNEFVVEGPRPAEPLLAACQARGILAGLPLAPDYPGMERRFLVCVTEQRTRAEIDALVDALAGGGA